METNTARPVRNQSTRRSQRLLLSIPVTVAGERCAGGKFVEETTTAVVNAHGAMVLLLEPVSDQQLLEVQNVKTGEGQMCRVVDIGAISDGKTEVGIEFIEPAPRFWHIAFPPEDWNLNNPEAKRSGKPVVVSQTNKSSQ